MRIADEDKPVVGIPVILKPVEVGLALRAVEPDITAVLLALEGNVPHTVCATAP